MLELWGMWSIILVSSLTQAQMGVPDRVLSMGQIELLDI